ncbi:desulfoferrodoxin [Desulfobotulus sp.]|uniref:desulfoferrodoxin n=1 Tax=Desulfobotulus sp. TaxID=1940337 RepID=UPI002A3671CD|nr:desulfoferrodoxin [Desulfobotulus sp.]MDY0164355.1 desulfoferrodoxin [Desulfobotulus sp.]
MVQRLEVYRCDLCGNVVEVMHGGAAALVCCGQPMVHLTENTVDAAKEKHVPVIERIPGGVKVVVGSVEHPMLEKHYVEWIEVIADNRVYRKDLNPGEKPEATFMIEAEKVVVREYCNLHGVWKAEG